jgi:N-acetylglucosamine-6-sulfatase
MRRRKVISFSAGLVALLVAAAVLALARSGDDPAHAQSQAARNVVFVMTDDQTVEQMKALPRVRRLIGREGTTFTRNFASFPLCCPSRATWLTGQYPHNHGVEGNGGGRGDGGYEELQPTHGNTLPAWLRDAGYSRRAHIGKYLNGYGSRTNPREVPAGWNDWHGSVDPFTYRFFGFRLNENGRIVCYVTQPRQTPRAGCDVERPRIYSSDLYTQKAVNFIQRNAPGGPFFLSVAYLAPHGGGPNGPNQRRCRGSAKPAPRHAGAFQNARLPRPRSFNERDVGDKPAHLRFPRLDPAAIANVRRDYICRRESLLAVDEGVERVVNAVRATGELDNTLIVFTSDNGFFQGEHRIPGGKINVYEPSVRVPLLIRGPGVPRNRRVNDLSANVDLAPTVLDAAGARPGRRIDGRSLLPVARRPSRFHNRDILLENGPRSTPGGRYIQYDAIRTSRWVFVRYINGSRELYNLARDRHQVSNLAGKRRYRRVERRLARKLRKLRRCTAGSCR